MPGLSRCAWLYLQPTLLFAQDAAFAATLAASAWESSLATSEYHSPLRSIAASTSVTRPVVSSVLACALFWPYRCASSANRQRSSPAKPWRLAARPA